MTASPASGTVSVLILRALVMGGMALGLEPRELAREAGVPEEALAPEVLADPDARVAAVWALRLWDYLPRRTGDESFGLWLAERLSGAPLTVAWWVVLASRTLGEGLGRALRYQRLLHDAAQSEVIATPGEVIYRHQVGAPPFRPSRHAIEFGFASLVQLARRATGQELVPVFTRLKHPAPAELARHRRWFGSAVTFDAEHDEIAFSRDEVERPLLTADDSLREIVEAHARALVERLPSDDRLSSRAAAVVCELLRDGAPRAEAVARRLGIPRRTLQRRLAAEGTSVATLVDGVRRELSERYLVDPRVSTQEVAFLVGFSDVSAFHRAFVRWTGVTPARFRTRGG